MRSTVTASSVPDHRQRLEGLRASDAKVLKKLEIGDWKAEVGHAIDRAISRANKTQKEAWAALGHNDGAQLNRWIAATERPQFDALFAVAWLRSPLVIELAKIAGAGVEIETTVRIRESA